MKQCQVCGNEIPWVKDDYPKRYQRKRFCSRQCQVAGRASRIARAVDAEGQLQCSKCKETKLVSEFPRDRITPTGYGYYCKKCHGAAVHAGKMRNPEKYNEARRLRKRLRYAERQERDREYYLRNRERIVARGRIWYDHSPQSWKAHKAIQGAVRKGELPKIAGVLCARCQAAAGNYHHPSYHEDDRLNVIPLCVSCHRLVHKYRAIRRRVETGVLLTQVGMVRIAIASVP